MSDAPRTPAAGNAGKPEASASSASPASFAPEQWPALYDGAPEPLFPARPGMLLPYDRGRDTATGRVVCEGFRELTAPAIEALEKLMEAELFLHRSYHFECGEIDRANCWTTAVAVLDDLALGLTHRIQYGGEDDFEGMIRAGESVGVWVVQHCRVCGCTDTYACKTAASRFGCAWVEPDLCSECHRDTSAAKDARNTESVYA